MLCIVHLFNDLSFNLDFFTLTNVDRKISVIYYINHYKFTNYCLILSAYIRNILEFLNQHFRFPTSLYIPSLISISLGVVSLADMLPMYITYKIYTSTTKWVVGELHHMDVVLAPYFIHTRWVRWLLRKEGRSYEQWPFGWDSSKFLMWTSHTCNICIPLTVRVFPLSCMFLLAKEFVHDVL